VKRASRGASSAKAKLVGVLEPEAKIDRKQRAVGPAVVSGIEQYFARDRSNEKVPMSRLLDVSMLPATLSDSLQEIADMGRRPCRACPPT
jgi:hypothetical protein